MRNQFWWIEIVRGMLTLGFGIVYLSLHAVLYLLIVLLGAYLLIDGCLDLLRIIRNKQTPLRHLSVYLGAAASTSLGLLSLLHPQLTLLLIGALFVLRIIIRGIQVFGEARRWQGRFAGLHWLYGISLLLLGLVCLLPAVFVLMTTFLLLFLGFYALGDGLSILGRGLHLGLAVRRVKEEISQAASTKKGLDIPADAPSTTRRALIFVHRSGASGLGHVGWAFEWLNGWFNAGSVENYSNRAFAPAGRADFWTAHTTSPVETMLRLGNTYDEYKVFFVTEPHPKKAWRVVNWVSRQPYRIVHRNCVDAAYDILRTYGLRTLPDPVTEYAPNDWYDSLSGHSYPIKMYPALPVHIRQFSARPLATQEIALAIPKTMQGTIPPWRTSGSGLRGLLEVMLVWQKMVQDVKTVLALPGKWAARSRWQVARRWETSEG